MLKRHRLLKQEPEGLDELYFKEIRPTLYELHGAHGQYGSRKGRTLAEHLDSACQFVLTVSKIAKVSEEKRTLILAATAVHDLNKLIEGGGSVKKLARDRSFLKEQLSRAGVDELVKTDDDLELVRRLIESHSGHNNSDGMRFIGEDPQVKDQIKRWSAMLIGGDLFDLGIEEDKRIRKVENELTVAFGRPSRLFKVRLSEDRGYLTSLLLFACEEVLHKHGLHTLAIDPDGQIFEGEAFPEEDLTIEIAKYWQKRIDRVFGSNIEQLITDKSTNGIKVDYQAIQQDPEAALERVDILLAKKYSNYKASKVAESIEKYCRKAGEDAVTHAAKMGLVPISTAEEFAISEGLKAAYVSYRQVKPQLTPNQVWKRISNHMGLSDQQCKALEAFEEQYGRCLFAGKASTRRMNGVQEAIKESFQMRLTKTDETTSTSEVSKSLIEAVRYLLNLPISRKQSFFEELSTYIEANPSQRSSLGSIRAEVSELRKPQMPPETKVQVFSNRLRGGSSGDPVRCADSLAALGYQLMQVGAGFPNAKKKSKSGGEAPVHTYYLHFSLPKGSSSELQGIWRKWLKDTANTNADGGAVKVNELQLYRDNQIAFESDKFEGFSLPKRPEFTFSTVTIPVVWGDVNSSVALLKSLRLALELSLAFDFGFPFILSANLEVKPEWEIFGRVEGLPSALQPLLGSGIYQRQGHLSQQEQKTSITAEEVLERLQCVGKLVISVASLQKKDDCLYDLARAAQRPLNLYHVLLRWILREQDDPNLEIIWTRIREPLTTLLRSLMSEEHDRVSHYLKQAAHIAEVAKLRGSSFRRTSQAEPFSEFIKAVRSRKSHMDWETIFAALVQEYHERLDRIREHGVGATKYEQIKQFYQVLRQLFEDVYHSRPERLLTDSKTLEAAYLFFLQQARQELKAQTQPAQTELETVTK
ncbi:MAG: CRISPR-associated protein Csc3 [Trichocoleus desertorum ATA4-8-CV12]|jgi:CRISPR-associated protein Csc3|nr:CRISPR-associated protein Csc3 [Trichocoleus desertorum ATA4-8-CV12]